MIGSLVAAALAAASPQASPPQASDTHPAIWVVRDSDTTIYLFGTFHALDGQSNWFDGRVKDAFSASDELVLETLVPEEPRPVAMPGFSAMSRQQIGTWSVAPSASFLTTTRMAISAGNARGMQVANGADMVLRRVAEAEGKDVEGLETLDLQLRMFDRMPIAAGPPVRPGEPVDNGNARTAMASLSNAMAEMQAAWKRGDQSVFVHMLDQLRQGSPETYRVMFTERNARWADWVAARMRTPGTVFVAVGAGHLAGKDSLLVRLAEHGIESSRLN